MSKNDGDGAAAMPSDDAIVQRLHEILASADLSKVSAKDIRLQMEREMGVNLAGKKAFLRDHIQSFMATADDSGEAEAADGMSDGADDSFRLKNKVKTAIKESVPSNAPRKKSGFQKTCQLSDALEAIVGAPQASRPEVVKLLWAYIREHNLQVPENKRNIKCDEALKKVFTVDYIDMFSMNKKLNKHIIPLDELAYEAGVARAEKRKARDEEAEKSRGVEERKSRAARKLARMRRAEERTQRKEDAKIARKEYQSSKKPGRGFSAPVRISEKLREFLGTEETKLARPDITKQLWEYIRTNQLQDPSDRRRILCDEKLENLLDCKSFNGFGGLPKLLQAHLTSAKTNAETS